MNDYSALRPVSTEKRCQGIEEEADIGLRRFHPGEGSSAQRGSLFPSLFLISPNLAPFVLLRVHSLF
jgi:hypothetical protein